LFALGDAVEKLLRLRGILYRQRAFVEARGKRPEYAGVIDPLLGTLDEQIELLFINSDRIGRFLSNRPLDPVESAALPGILQKVIDVVLGLHELLILLPREAVEPQAFYLLKDCFESEWNDSSIVTTNALEAYEYRVEDVLQNLKDLGQHGVRRWRKLLRGFTSAGSVLAQAFIDRDNPLAWPALAHEYGHALDEARKICTSIVRGNRPVDKGPGPQNDFEVKWVSEIFADFVAARVLGPASQMPILLLEMGRPSLVAAEDEAPAHPPTAVRLKLVRDYLNGLKVRTEAFDEFFEIYGFDYQQKLGGASKEERSAREQFEEMAEELRPHVEAVAENVGLLKLKTFGEQHLERAGRLKERLRDDLPVSCLGMPTSGDMLSRLDSLSDSRMGREAVYAVLTELNEAPSTTAEILTAGWLYKLETFEAKLRLAFPGGQQDAMDLDSYAKYLARTDELVLRSIELSVVHGEMTRERTNK
jgi:hypothetical protein